VSTTDTGVEASAPEPSGASAPANEPLRWALLALILALLLVAAGAFIWLAADRLGNDQSELQTEREQVMSVSEQFMLRLGNHDPSMLDGKGQMPEYRRLVEELATTTLKTKLEQQDFEIAEKVTDQAGLTRATQVYATGVQSIDNDSASVLVAGAITDSFGTKDVRDPEAFRFRLSLVKVDGAWLVDSFGRAGDDQ